MTKQDFQNLLKEKVLILDGGMGTLLQERGLKPGQCPEELNLSGEGQKILKSIHIDYLKAGANVILTNTFGAIKNKLIDYNLQTKLSDINFSAVKIARECAKNFGALVAGNIGMSGSYLIPIGPISFEASYKLFSEQVKLLAQAEVDLIIIETMSDIREVKSSLLAAKDYFNGPIIVSMTFTEDGTTVTGTGPLTFISVAESMGADCLGINCSVGPKEIYPTVCEILKNTKLPVMVKPNRGIPKLINRQTIFPGTVEEFIEYAEKYYDEGANLIGGCCGTTPEFIKGIANLFKNKKPVARSIPTRTLISSRSKCLVVTNSSPLIKIGERINPTGKKELSASLKENNFNLVRSEAIAQTKEGADVLDINVGVPKIDEAKTMAEALEIVQQATALPLCIDSSSITALKAGLIATEGKPILNSISLEEEKLKEILPLVKKYGAVVIALTIDGNNLPKDSKDRIRIAEKLIEKCLDYGISKEDIIIDNLALTVSAQQSQAVETLKAIKYCSEKLKVHTNLGISNISFGLPNRYLINSTFLKLAVDNGLSFAIVNPLDNWNIFNDDAKKVLLGEDVNSLNYIKKYSQIIKNSKLKIQNYNEELLSPEKKLYNAIVEGDKDNVLQYLDEVLKLNWLPEKINNEILLKAMDEVGLKFQVKEYFLPQVILSAESMQRAFNKVKTLLKKEETLSKGKVVLATVKGDIHDIGKNILAAVLENSGFEVINLGKNVDTEKIIQTAENEKANIIGLSALMTTTMVVMEDIIKSVRQKNLKVKIIVGGAAVNKKFAAQIGADGYGKDAMEGVEIVKKLIKL